MSRTPPRPNRDAYEHRPGAVQDFLAHVEEAEAQRTVVEGEAPEDGWVAAKDMFEGLLADARQTVETMEEDDLQAFFKADEQDRHDERMRRVARRTSGGGEDGWPDHNYGPAYWRQHARRRMDRREPERRGLWEIEALDGDTAHPMPPPEFQEPASRNGSTDASAAGWRAPARIGVRDDPTGWLASLEEEAPVEKSTARLVGVARGDSLERWITVCEIEETLVARPKVAKSTKQAQALGRSTRTPPAGSPAGVLGAMFGRF